MTEILSSDVGRMALLALLFIAVVGVSYGIAVMVGERRQFRERLVEGGPSSGDPNIAVGAGLRVHDARGAWLTLVTAIEKTGIPLVDTKDATLRSRLVAAGYKGGLRLYWACPWEPQGEPLGAFRDPFAAVDAAYRDIQAREG